MFPSLATSSPLPPSVRQFTFSSPNNNNNNEVIPEIIHIYVNELLDADYGLFVWPSAVTLADFLFQQRNCYSGKHVIELGCGTALVGLLLAKVGSFVTLTDRNDLSILKNIRDNCKLNGVENGVRVMPLVWGEFTPSFFELFYSARTMVQPTNNEASVDLSRSSFDVPASNPTTDHHCESLSNINTTDQPLLPFEQPMFAIVCADCLYDKKAFDDLFCTVRFLLKQSRADERQHRKLLHSSCEFTPHFLCAYHCRCTLDHDLEYTLAKWGMMATNVTPHCPSQHTGGDSVSLLMIVLKNDDEIQQIPTTPLAY
jgi:predicted nicotinamide N-methyase